MDVICTGTEQSNWDLAASEQLEIDGANTAFTLTADRLVKIEVQLGAVGKLLQVAVDSILVVTVKITPDTGDQCIFPQKVTKCLAASTLALISLDLFWAGNGSVIEVHAKSSAAADDDVGGKVWVRDIAPADISGVAVPGDEMTLENDAITSTKYDESSAHPITVAMKEAGASIVRGTVTTGFPPTTTEFVADDITEATADHFNGRVIIFVTGALQGQQTDITDYDLLAGRGHFTVTALTEAPGDDDTFVIV